MIIIKISKRDACILKVVKIILKPIWKWPLQNITKIFWRKSYKVGGFALLDIEMHYGSTITKIWRWTFKIYGRGNTANKWRVINAVVSTEISALRKKYWFLFIKQVQFSSVTQSSLTVCDTMGCSMSSLPVHHQLLQSTQTHVHWVSDAIQPSYPRSSPSPPASAFQTNKLNFS